MKLNSESWAIRVDKTEENGTLGASRSRWAQATLNNVETRLDSLPCYARTEERALFPAFKFAHDLCVLFAVGTATRAAVWFTAKCSRTGKLLFFLFFFFSLGLVSASSLPWNLGYVNFALCLWKTAGGGIRLPRYLSLRWNRNCKWAQWAWWTSRERVVGGVMLSHFAT